MTNPAPSSDHAEMAELDLSVFESHTPGPWGTRKHGVITGGVVREYTNGSSQDQLAMVCSTQDDNGGQIAFDANARLIAAAPQLLAELRRLRDVRASSEADLEFAYEVNAWVSRLNNQASTITNMFEQLATAERTIAELREKLEKSQAAYETEWSQNEVLRTRAEAAELTNKQLAEKCLKLVAENDLLRARTADQLTNGGD